MDDIGFFFNYQDRLYQLPVNPEELSVQYPGNNESKTVVALGEITLLQKRKLAKLSISSWLPEQPWHSGLRTTGGFQPAIVYDELFRGILESEDYMRLVVTGINLNMLVSIEDYKSSHQSGDYEDIYYTLDLKEFKPTSAVQIPITSENIALTIRNTFSLGSGGTGSSGTFVSTPTRVTVGSLVLVTGELHASSMATEFDTLIGNQDSMLLKYQGRVSHIREGNDYPYHITDTSGNWLGWVSKDSVSIET